jgi:hypothetical protein
MAILSLERRSQEMRENLARWGWLSNSSLRCSSSRDDLGLGRGCLREVGRHRSDLLPYVQCRDGDGQLTISSAVRANQLWGEGLPSLMEMEP